MFLHRAGRARRDGAVGRAVRDRSFMCPVRPAVHLPDTCWLPYKTRHPRSGREAGAAAGA